MKTFFDTYELTIAANGIKRLDTYNSFLTLLENSSTTAVKVAIGGGMARASLHKGLSIELPQGERFKYLIFENQTGASITIEVALSTGRVYDNRVVLSGTLPIVDVSDVIETPAKLAVTAASAVNIAADTDQKEIIIQNTGSYDIWIGDSNVDPANSWGVKITPDSSIILDTTAQIYLQADGTDSQVSYMRLKTS